jgi:hypothetical protein
MVNATDYAKTDSGPMLNHLHRKVRAASDFCDGLVRASPTAKARAIAVTDRFSFKRPVQVSRRIATEPLRPDRATVAPGAAPEDPDKSLQNDGKILANPASRPVIPQMTEP